MAKARARAGQDDVAPICAIGAAAPGVTALDALISALPNDLGLAHVVLCPGIEPGALVRRLSERSRMPVVGLADVRRLERDRVHVAPFDRRVVIAGDAVETPPFSEPREALAPIDALFRTVAGAHDDGLGVVLSGPGSDGALGVRAIREGAGVVLVQSPAEAGLATMPRAAMASGAVDFVLPVAEIAARIAQVTRARAAAATLVPEDAVKVLRRILDRVGARTGHDFSGYDDAVMLDRVLRRLQVAGAADLPAYEARLRDAPEEAGALFADLLRPITMFFRDPDAFAGLAEAAIPTIVEEADPAQGVRVWVVGCSSGEEAYSVAMLFLEEADRRGVALPLQVFATDVDAAGLAVARDGCYPSVIELDVTEERLARFFVREGNHYRVSERLRGAVLFAQHDVLRDPPFTRMDLDTCRHVLTLFGPEMRERALSRMHYALRPDGHLFLGAGERADPELFAPLREDAALHMARPRAARLPAEVVVMPGSGPMPGTSAPPGGELPKIEAWAGPAPPAIAVDEDRRVLHLSETAGRYLRPSAGPFPQDLASLARPELRSALVAALQRALVEDRPTVTSPESVAMNGARHRVALLVRPMPEPGAVRALVMFLDGGPLGAEVDEDEDEDASAEVVDLRERLRIAEGRLALCWGEREAAVGELRAAEEELGSAHEELISTRGELDACRMEGASALRELRAVLEARPAPGRDAPWGPSALAELGAAAGIGAMALDAHLRPIGEPPDPAASGPARALVELAGGPDWARVAADAADAMREGAPAEREFRAADGRRHLLRLLPRRGEVGILLCVTPVPMGPDA